MDLSVVIVNFNTKELTSACLTSIYTFTKNLKFEIILVDNASSDGSQAYLKNKFPNVNFILNKKNLGFAKANNQGIKIANGKYILLLNSDTYLVKNAFSQLVKFAENKGDFGAIAPRLLNEDNTIQQSVGFFPHLPQLFYWISFLDDLPFGLSLKPYHVDHDKFYKKEQEVDWITGAAILIKRDNLAKIGLLDEDIFMYGEDVEWCYRIKKAGFSVVFTPTTEINHIGRGSNKKNSTSAFVGEFKGIIYFYKKYKSPFSLQIAKILLKIGALARICVFSLLGRFQLAKSYVEAFKVA